MTNDLRIVLQATIDKVSLQNIREQLSNISKDTQIVVDAKLDNKIFENIKQLSKQLEKLSTSVDVDIDSSKLDKITEVHKRNEKGVMELHRKIADITDEYGKQARIIKEVDSTTGELVETEIRLSDNKNKRLREEQQIQNALAKTEMNRIKEREKWEREQAKHINKALEDNYKLMLQEEKRNQKIKERIELFQQRMLGDGVVPGEMDIFAEKNKGRFSPGIFDYIKSEVEGLQNLPLDDQIKRLRVLNTEWNLLKRTATQSSSLLTRTIENMGKFLRFYLAGGIIVNFVRQLKGGIRYINDLDSALTEIGMVTNQTREQVAGLSKEFNNMAKELKVATSHITTGAVEFYRQGLQQEEVMERLRTTTMYSKVANLDFTQSAELLTAAVNSMGIDIERAADVFLYLGDATATSGAEIGIGFSKVGGAAASLGIEFEKVASWIATISARTRESAQSIGTSINAILSRLSRITEVGFDEEDGTRINDVAKALGTIGITLMDAAGNFRDFGTIMDEIADKWDSLNDKTKAYIAYAMAGTRQQSRFYNLMEGYAESVRLYEESLDAAGTAHSKFQIYLQSNQATLDEFKATLEGLWISAISSDSLMTIVRGGTQLVSAIDSLVKEFGTLASVVALLAPLIGVKLALAFRKTYVEVVKLIAAGVSKEILSQAGFFYKLATALTGVGTAAKGATVGLTGLTLATAGITAGIGLLVYGITKWAQKSREAKEAFQNALDNSQQLNNEINNLDRLVKKYEELSKIENKSVEQKEALLQVQRELAQLYPELATGVDEEGNKIAENIELTKQLAEEKRQLLEQELLVIKTEADTRLPQLRRELEEMQKEAKEIQRRLTSGDTKVEVDIEGTKVAIDETKKLQKRLLELVEYQREYIDEINRLEEGVKSYNKIVEERVEKEKIIRAEQLATQAANAKTISQLQEIEKELLELGFTAEEVATIMTDGFEEVKEKIEDTEYSSNNLRQSISMHYEEVSKAVDEYDLFSQALKELNEEGQVSKSTLDKLIEVMPNIIELTGLQKDKMIELMNTSREKRRQIIDDEIAATKASTEATVQQIMNVQSYAEALTKLARLKAGMSAFDRGARTGDPDLDRELEDQYYRARQALALIEETNRQIQALEGMKSLFDSVDRRYTPRHTSRHTSGRSSGTTKEYKAEADRYARINLELEKNNFLLQKNQSLQELVGSDLQKKLQLMDEEIKLNKQRQQILHELNNERRREMQELERTLSGYGFRFAGEGDNRIITNLEHIKGKTKEVEEQFNRYIELQSKLIPQASQEWWNLRSAIEQTTLNRLTTEFELADQKISQLNKTLSDLEYQLKLIDDTDIDGQITNITRQIEILEEQIGLAKAELQSLGEVGDDALQVIKDRQEELTKRIQDGTLAIKTLEQSLFDIRERLRQQWVSEQNKLYEEQQDRIRALERIQEKIVQIIRKRGEEEKKALEEAYRTEIETLEKRHKERKKKYQEDLDEFRKYIQARLDALDEQWEEEDYYEQLEKEREEAARLQREIDILSLDDSLTARNKVIELRRQLAEQNEKIAKMQQKRERDLLRKSLQDQLKDREKDAKEKEEIADRLYENERKRLEEEYRINKEFLERKYSDEKVYAEARESIMRGQVEVAEGVFMDIYDAFVEFENKFGRGMGILGDIIRNDFIAELEKAQDAIRNLDYLASNRLPYYDSNYDPGDDILGWREPPRGSPRDTGLTQSEYERYKLNKKRWEELHAKPNKTSADLQQMKQYARENQAFRDKYGIPSDDYGYSQLQRMSLEDFKRIYGIYKYGGETSRTGLHWLDGKPSQPERVLSAQQTKDFNKLIKILENPDFLNTLKNIVPKVDIRMPNIPAVVTQGAPVYIDRIFEITGTVTKDTIPLIRKEANNIERIITSLNKYGAKRPLKFR